MGRSRLAVAARYRGASGRSHTQLAFAVAVGASAGLIYFAAFITSAFQCRALFGSNGLTPYGASSRPTPVFAFAQTHLGLAGGNGGVPGDALLEAVSWVGVFLSLMMMALPTPSRPCWAGLPLALWATYLSIVNLGGTVINYGYVCRCCVSSSR